MANLLRDKVASLLTYFCFFPRFLENPRPGPKNDFVFLMDSSSDVTRLDFTREILFVKSLARELSISSSEFQAAVIAYGNR